MSANSDLTVIMTTIGRTKIAMESIVRLRGLLPESRIIVGDQNGDRKLQSFYDLLAIDVMWLDRDTGLSAARNRLVEKVDTKFFLLTDDDDEITSGETVMVEILQKLEVNPDWLVVGAKKKYQYEYFLRFSEDGGVLVKRPLMPNQVRKARSAEDSGPKNLSFFEADTVHNCAVFSTEAFRQLGLEWDEDMKINGEHLDFYTALWVRKREGLSHHKVVFCPQFECSALPRAKNDSTYRSLRSRRTGNVLYSRKWGVTTVITIDSIGKTVVVDVLDRDKVWAHALGVLADVLDQNSIRWMVSNGTLLGLIRDGIFIAHDSDMDLILAIPKLKIEDLLKSIWQAGFLPVRVYGRPGSGLEVRIMSPAPSYGRWLYGSILIDLFFADETIEGIFTSRYNGGLRRRYRYPSLETTKTFFAKIDLELSIPVHPEEFLENEYGKEWTQSQTDWDWWSSPLNLAYGRSKKLGILDLIYEYFFYRSSKSLVLFRKFHPYLGKIAYQLGRIKYILK